MDKGKEQWYSKDCLEWYWTWKWRSNAVMWWYDLDENNELLFYRSVDELIMILWDRETFHRDARIVS